MTPPEVAYGSMPSEAAARNELVMSEISQVYYIAKRIQHALPSHVALEDLVHAGVLGLIDAVRKFDSSKNASLKSYAAFRIRGAIIDSLRELDWGSRRVRQKGRLITESIARLRAKLEHEPTEPEIADDLGISLAELHKRLQDVDGLLLVGQFATSHSDGAEELDLIESAPADERENPFELCLQTERSELLGRAVATLAEREQTILSLYYREELTMKEIANILDLAESRVSQLHSLAIVKLRAALEQMEFQQEHY